METRPAAIGRLLARVNAGLERLGTVHPRLERAVKVLQRKAYERRFFGDGPRRQGRPDGCTFVIFNHHYDLDVDALCAAETPHTLWVLDPFALFKDMLYYFPPEHRDLLAVYGTGKMRDSIERFKAGFVRSFARRLQRETGLGAMITPSDIFYYQRPLIEELRELGIPTIVQDKEGTISPSAIMDDHARVLTERYPPIADQYYFWSESHREFWRRVGVSEDRMKVLGQPRSDFFFHPERWPPKTSLGVAASKPLIVVFTYDADTYARPSTEPNPERPWKPLRDHMHAAVRELARVRSDIEVVIKAHPQQVELAEIAAELAADPLPNVKLVTGSNSASHLLVHADVIVGFQSTVMIEAMLTKAPVIYAGWGTKHDELDAGLIPIHRSGGCSVPRDRAELDRMLRDALAGKLAPTAQMMQMRRTFTHRYFADADGHAAERVLQASAQFVANLRRQT